MSEAKKVKDTESRMDRILKKMLDTPPSPKKSKVKPKTKKPAT